MPIGVSQISSKHWGLSMRPNEEIRIRWTGSARFDEDQAAWAVRAARKFAVENTDNRERRTGIRRSMFFSGGVLAKDQTALLYFTKSGIVIVNIYGDSKETS